MTRGTLDRIGALNKAAIDLWENWPFNEELTNEEVVSLMRPESMKMIHELAAALDQQTKEE